MPPSIYNNGCCMINNAYFSYDIAIIFCHFIIFFAQIQIHFVMQNKNLNRGYKNKNVNVKGKNSVKNISTIHTTD